MVVLTDVLENLVALVENEHLEVVKVESLVFGEMEDSAWRANDDVRAVGTLEELLLLLEGLTTEDALSLHIGQEFGKASKFSLDLESQLAGVSQNEGSAGLGVVLEAVKHREHEDGSLAHA